MILSELKNKKIAILGFWKEGKSTLRFLLRQWINDITILDKQEISKELLCEDFKWSVYSWEKYLANIADYDVIFKTPGISPFQRELIEYRDKFTSQSELFFSAYKWKVIGLTGTKWKSTCSTLLYTCLKQAWYDVQLVGNIGDPVLDVIDLFGDMHDYVVYELSSYMLQDFTPELEVGFLNNIYPCHLDWHYDSFAIYKQAKVNILLHAKTKIIHGNFSHISEIAELNESKIFFDSKGKYRYNQNGYKIEGEYIYTGEQKLLWDHNRANISWVITILDTLLHDRVRLAEVLLEVLPHFAGLPNRLEDIWVYEWICFINDAIATTPESTMAGIATFHENIQTIFLWGEDSGFDFSKLRTAILESKIQNIIAFPHTSEKIFPEIELRDYEKAFEIEIQGKQLQFIRTRSMRQWVDFSFRTTFAGRVALLSCAAPSYSLWKNYILKAEEFKKEVQRY